MSAPLGLDNPAGGLAIKQLLKLKARGMSAVSLVYMRTHSGTTNVDGDRSDCGLGKSAIAVQYPDFCPVLERISPRTQFQY